MDINRQQKAPIYEALEEFKKRRVVPFDVPGHKRGRGNPELVQLLGQKCVELDVNSMKPLDNLCHPVSVIREAEELTADAFGAENAFLMVGGTTSAVQAMILSTCKAGDKIILPRNVHKSALNALVLCGAVPVYVNPEMNAKLGISLGMEIDQVARAIEDNPDAKAVLVNNPTYYGICSDLRAIVKLAHSRGIKVLTDEAHGTHLYFWGKPSGMWYDSRRRHVCHLHAQIRGKPYTKLHPSYRESGKSRSCQADYQSDTDNQCIVSPFIES